MEVKILEALTENDLKRYNRQIIMPGFGEAGQRKLKNSKVFVAGAGGLGSPVSVYLAVAGIGHIKMVDHDVIELSNLNRQILHWDMNIGKKKAESAHEKLSKINPDIDIEAIYKTISADNVDELVGNADVIVDAMDNFPTRYILNDSAIKKKIPFVHGAIWGMEGRATTIIPGKTACLRCIFPEAPKPEVFPVFGAAPGLIGCLQVIEVIKYLSGIGNLLTNKLLIFDGLTSEISQMYLQRNANCKYCGHL